MHNNARAEVLLCSISDTSRRFCLRLLTADSAIAPSCYFSISLTSCCASVRTRDSSLEKVVLAQWVAWNKLTQLCLLWSTRKPNFASSSKPLQLFFIFHSFSTSELIFYFFVHSDFLINKSTMPIACDAGQTSRAAAVASHFISSTICACCVPYCRSQTAWSPCPCCAHCCMACHRHWHEHIRVSSCCFLSGQWEWDNETQWSVQVLRGKNVLKDEDKKELLVFTQFEFDLWLKMMQPNCR